MAEPGALTAALNWYRAMDGDVLDDLLPVAVPTLFVWSITMRLWAARRPS